MTLYSQRQDLCDDVAHTLMEAEFLFFERDRYGGERYLREGREAYHDALTALQNFDKKNPKRPKRPKPLPYSDNAIEGLRAHAERGTNPHEREIACAKLAAVGLRP